MNPDRQLLDETIRNAVEQHGATLDPHIPDFGDLIALRHRRTRRTLGVATVCVALLGIGGIVVAASRANDGAAATTEPNRSDGVPDAEAPLERATTVESSAPATTTTVTTSLPVVVEYSCTDPIGEDQLGRQLFGACEPAPDGPDGDYACTDRIGARNGFVVFASCESVGQLGQLPGSDGDAPFDNPTDIAVRRSTYVVQPGDYGLKIAQQFCVSISDLNAANGWVDVSLEFPSPGTEILIPLGFDDSGCDLGSYTITEDDTTRISVAEKFCISVQALDEANLGTEGYASFFPGLTIAIPSGPSTDC